MKMETSKLSDFVFQDILLYRVPTGPIQENAYLLVKNGQSLLVDPGDDAQKLAKLIEETQTSLQAILITHAHWDHVGAVEQLRKNAPVYLHPDANEQLTNAKNAAARWNIVIEQPNPADFELKTGDLTIGNFNFKVLSTPGHASGHVSFYFSEGFVLSGDALFNNGIGRTDLPGGNHNLLISSIKKELLTLPGATLVFSGHGLETTIEAEIKTNPFLK